MLAIPSHPVPNLTPEVVRWRTFANAFTASALQVGKDTSAVGAGCRPLIRSPRRRAQAGASETVRYDRNGLRRVPVGLRGPGSYSLAARRGLPPRAPRVGVHKMACE